MKRQRKETSNLENKSCRCFVYAVYNSGFNSACASSTTEGSGLPLTDPKEEGSLDFRARAVLNFGLLGAGLPGGALIFKVHQNAKGFVTELSTAEDERPLNKGYTFPMLLIKW